MPSSPTAEINGGTSPATSPGQTGASPGSVSAALGNGHAGGAEIVQSLVRTQLEGGFTIDGDGIGDGSEVASADATTEPDSQSESGASETPTVAVSHRTAVW